MFSLLLFTQCKSTHETLGCYSEFYYYYTPSHVFYYDDSMHASCMVYHFTDDGYKCFDSFMTVVQQQKNTNGFYNGNISVDTVHLYYGANGFQYLFTYTPSLCTFHWIGRENPNGTYTFKPNACERGLVSFAVSRLDFRDTLPESVEERYARENEFDGVVMESPECVLQIKTEGENINRDFYLLSDRLPISLFFLIDALEAMIRDYSKPEYRTAEEPDMREIDRFNKILIDKYAPLPSFENGRRICQ